MILKMAEFGGKDVDDDGCDFGDVRGNETDGD